MQDGGYYDILVQTLDLFHSNDSESVWGVIGPGDDPSLTDFIAPISEDSGLITVRLISHGSTSTNVDSYFTLIVC